MSENDKIIDVVVQNDDETVGVVLPRDMDEYVSTPVQLGYFRELLSLADEMGWDDAWIGVKDGSNPVLLEHDDDNEAAGALAIAPLEPEGDDDG